MNQLVREFKQIKKVKLFLILFIFITIPNIIMVSISDRVSLESWRNSAESTKITYSDFLNDGSDEENKFFKDQLEVIDYCLDNDIPYKVKNSWIHMSDMKFLGIVIIFIIIFATNNIYSREYKMYTWNELLENKKGNNGIFLKKALSSFIQSFICLVIMLSITFGFGTIVYGINGNFKMVNLIDGNIVVVNVLSNIFKNYILLLFKIIFYVSFTIMISVIFKEKKIGLCFPILLATVGDFNLLPFKCFNTGIVTPYGEVAKGIVIFSLLSIAFYFIALKIFKTQEEFLV